MRKKFYIRTFGCQMNLADSETLSGALTATGWEPATEPEAADLKSRLLLEHLDAVAATNTAGVQRTADY